MTKQIKGMRMTILWVAAMCACAIGVAPAADKQPNKRIAPEHPGLLILSHGAPSPEWNEPVNDLVERVRKQNEKEKTFHKIEGAFLEFAQPDAAAGIEALEKAGCDHVVVAPLFIASSSHSHFDVPAVLGLYSSPDIRNALKEEGARVASPKVPVALTQTLSEGDLLAQFACDQVRKISRKPQEEALVIVAHGCPDHEGLVDRMVRRVTTYCCGQSGIDYGDWAYCAVGQTFWEEAAPAIARAADSRKRVLVVGLYVSSSARRVYARALRSAQGPMGAKFRNPLGDVDIAFSEEGVVSHPQTARWLLDTATSALPGK